MILSRVFMFESSHQLEWHKGKCKKLHGHSYTLEISIKGKPGEHDIVMDFGDIQTIVEDNVLQILDHNHLNDIIHNPTAENIVIWIWNRLESILPLWEIALWEGKKNRVTYRREEHIEQA